MLCFSPVSLSLCTPCVLKEAFANQQLTATAFKDCQCTCIRALAFDKVSAFSANSSLNFPLEGQHCLKVEMPKS